VALGSLVCLATLAVLFLRLPWIRTETLAIPSGDITLAATLALPRWQAGPYPAVVVVHGSGSLPRWVYWSYARQLVPHGMAVLLYDKRGTGASGGTLPQSTRWQQESIEQCGALFTALAGDARAAVRALVARPDIDRHRIGLAGISQAGWIMPLAADGNRDVAFIVSISGPAVSCGLEDWYSQLTGEYADSPDLGAPTPFAKGELTPAEIEQRLDGYQGPAGHEPEPVLARTRAPTLWLLGGRDISVPVVRSAAVLERLAAAGAPIEVRMYPEGNHVLARGDGQWPRIDYWPDVRAWLVRQGILKAPVPADGD
jgi:dienelactone hydrolase